MEQGIVNRLHDVLALTGQCKSNDRTIGLQQPHDWPQPTARLGFNDRTIGPQRPHDSAATGITVFERIHWGYSRLPA